MAVLEELKEKLKSYEGVIDIDDTFDRGKNELLFKVNELGRKYGLTNNEVGRQVRAAYNGVTALKFQRDLDEVTVRVEYPDREKKGDRQPYEYVHQNCNRYGNTFLYGCRYRDGGAWARHDKQNRP